MNKLLIVCLAVCLVTVQAFVKRDTPVTEKNYLEDISKTFSDVTNTISQQVKAAMNPEELKKNLGEFQETFNKQFEDLKNKVSSIGSEQSSNSNPTSST